MTVEEPEWVLSPLTPPEDREPFFILQCPGRKRGHHILLWAQWCHNRVIWDITPVDWSLANSHTQKWHVQTPQSRAISFLKSWRGNKETHMSRYSRGVALNRVWIWFISDREAEAQNSIKSKANQESIRWPGRYRHFPCKSGNLSSSPRIHVQLKGEIWLYSRPLASTWHTTTYVPLHTHIMHIWCVCIRVRMHTHKLMIRKEKSPGYLLIDSKWVLYFP